MKDKMIYNNMKVDLAHIYIKVSALNTSFSANKIQKTLTNVGLGIRRKTLLSLLRQINNTEHNGNNSTLLYTPVKYLSEGQKLQKYYLLAEKMLDKDYRKSGTIKRNVVRKFMKTDGYDEYRTLTHEEKVEDTYNEMNRYMTYEKEMR